MALTYVPVTNTNPTLTGAQVNGNLTVTGFTAINNGQSAGTFTVFGGQLILGTVGVGLAIKEGVNATSGAVTLVAGTATVATTKVTANSRIQLTPQSLGTVTAPKAVGVTTRTPGTSFVVTSADATDTSIIAWTIVEPA
jgi:hypothetical protein